MLEKYIAILSSGIFLGGIYALLALGLTIILGVVRIMNLAHGAALMLTMYISFWIYEIFGIHPYFSAPIIVIFAFLLGAAIQKIVIERIPGAPMDMVLLVTLALAIVLENLALFLWGADYRSVHTSLNSMFVRLGPINVSYPRIIAFLVSILAAISLYYLLRNTMIGKALRAVAQDDEAAQLMGINTKTAYLLAMGIGTALAGLGGIVLMPIYYVFPSVGSFFMIVAVIVIFLGGLGNMVGCIVGGFIIGVVEVFSGYFLTTALKETIYFSVFILILLFKPTGIIGLGKGSERIGM